MARDYWQADKLLKAAQLLTDAARNLHTSCPHSVNRPDPSTVPAVNAMIDTALECINQVRPQP